MRSRTFAFPFAFEVSQGFRNVGLTLAQLTEFYYRVRQMEMEIFTSDGDAATTIINLQYIGPLGPPATEQEIELYTRTHSSGNGSGTLSYTVNCNVVPWYNSGDELYYILVEGLFQTDGGGFASTDPATGPLSPMVFTFNGINVPLYGACDGTVDIVYSLWWEYRKSDGTNPIWDAATGAQLLDPHQTDQLP